eukprot:7057197-Prymnesium_polylepis.1
MDCWTVHIDSPHIKHAITHNTRKAQMSNNSDNDVIDTGAAVNDAVQAAAARMGLQQVAPKASTGGRARHKRTAAPIRNGPIWDSVTITREHDTSPGVKCNNCGKEFCGGSTRVEQHILDQCACESEAFLTMKDKLLKKRDEKDELKKQKVTVNEMNAVSEMKTESVVKSEVKPKMGQQKIQASLSGAAAEGVDVAIAEAFYGLNLAPNITRSPLWKKMVEKIKTAPASYKSPDDSRLMGDLLDSTTAKLKSEEAPVREAVMRDGGTVVSDGWDDVDKNHLINFLVGNAKGMFFDGTIMLSSSDHEDAKAVAELICAEIDRQGAGMIVQVVTDTCSVMKAAWKIIEE